ncbi:hypothetical protein P9G84_31490 [Brevibacillus centrosporus]|uniref:hypothetical protein n=1 Tax=Brevibacillus centrosporus TaxID=54910 RepID=UPI0011449E40|nr:hypothetical protein [Brevibacillus centrosporus]MEC2133382.1 hypothetical protein [Brevibacillus centrosporus]GED34877.1 hypothetical protein BCE02nite_60180 [Brevibacillus centrosporus]
MVLEVNSLRSIDFDKFMVFQVGQEMIEPEAETALIANGALVQTLTIQVDPRQQAEVIKRNIVGSIPGSLLQQIKYMESLPSYLEERCYVIILRTDEEEMRGLASEYDINLIQVTQEDIWDLIEKSTNDNGIPAPLQ